MKKCCDSNKNDKICIRSDGKTFKLPRRFPKKSCLTKKIRGFSMRSSCAPYKKCMKGVDQVPWPQKQHTACKYFSTFTNNLHTNLMSLLTIELHCTY